MSKRISLRKCINDKCKECIYDSYSPGTWRQQVAECTSPECPLYGVRPFPIEKAKKPQKNGSFYIE